MTVDNVELGQHQACLLDDPNISSSLKPITGFENWITTYGTESGSGFDLRANIPGEISNDLSAAATGIAGYVDQHGWNTVPQFASDLWNGAVDSVKTTYDNFQTSGFHALVPDSQSTGSNLDNAYFANLIGDQGSFNDSMAGNALDATGWLSAGAGASPFLVVRKGLPDTDDIDLIPAYEIPIVRLDASAAVKGTPGYDLLNDPTKRDPFTLYDLGNGKSFITNEYGYVDELTFTPEDIKVPRDSRQTGAGEKGRPTDVGGHAQACSQGGTCDEYNLFPQDSNFNNSAYKIWYENKIKPALADPNQTVGQTTIRYIRNDPASYRPDELVVTYIIDGKKRTIKFENEAHKTPEETP